MITLIQEACEKQVNLVREHGKFFTNNTPILWFGNMSSNKPKVVVISANPSNQEYTKGNPRFPNIAQWKQSFEMPPAKLLKDDYNNYFSRNPMTSWFGKMDIENGQGRIEQFLNGLNASFYDNEKYKYQAIHIDLLPFPTAKNFTQISNQILAIEGFPEWVDKHVKELIELIHPQLIVINGNSNFNFFNQCLNIGAQPYKAIVLPLKSTKEATTTIWVSIGKPTLIATSLNMGSYCMHSWDTIMRLGERVKKQLKLY